MTALHATAARRAQQTARPLINGLVFVLGIDGGVFTMRTIPRLAWTRQ